MIEKPVEESNENLINMILISLLKLHLEYGGKGVQADCEYKGVKYRLVFTTKDNFKDDSETL